MAMDLYSQRDEFPIAGPEWWPLMQFLSDDFSGAFFNIEELKKVVEEAIAHPDCPPHDQAMILEILEAHYLQKEMVTESFMINDRIKLIRGRAPVISL
ncbi:MAG: hypothetical protein AAB590_01850 [Patescibacteria group bacterium]